MITVPIRTEDGEAATREIKATKVTQVEMFVIGPSIGYRERWTLTHLPTGHRVCGAHDQAVLKRIAVRLANEVPTVNSGDVAVIKADGQKWQRIIREGLYGTAGGS